MCYYRLYIFLGCGHSSFSTNAIRPCAAVRSKALRELADHDHGYEGGMPEEDAPSESVPAAHTTSIGLERTTSQTTSSSELNAEDFNDDIPLTPATSVSEYGPALPIRSAFSTTTTNAKQSMTKPTDSPPTITWTPCTETHTHPYQTVKLDTTCGPCTRSRAALLAHVESLNPRVRFEDWQWKVKYLSPVPEEARFADSVRGTGSALGGVGVRKAMGSWVKKGEEILGVLREGDGGNGRRRMRRTGAISENA
jgi:hypothetical protein